MRAQRGATCCACMQLQPSANAVASMRALHTLLALAPAGGAHPARGAGAAGGRVHGAASHGDVPPGLRAGRKDAAGALCGGLLAAEQRTRGGSCRTRCNCASVCDCDSQPLEPLNPPGAAFPLQASSYLNKLPPSFSPEDIIIVTDPMLATGGTMMQVRAPGAAGRLGVCAAAGRAWACSARLQPVLACLPTCCVCAFDCRINAACRGRR